VSGRPLRLVAVLDGLRRGDLTRETTPRLAARAEAGCRYHRAVTAVPALTGAAAAVIATGCHPDRTGILGNRIWWPDTGIFEVGSISGLREAQRARGELLGAPTLGAVLAGRGQRLAVIATCTAGFGYLLALGGQSAIWARTPDEALTSAAAAAADADCLMFWSGEPDSTQHRFGTGSPEAAVSLREVDATLESLIRACERTGRAVDVIVTSDHGAVPCRERVDVEAEVRAAAGAGAVPRDTVACANDGAVLFYLPCDPRPADLGQLVSWLRGQAWCGPLFSRTGTEPGALPLELIGCRADRGGADVIAFTRTEGDGAFAASGPDSRDMAIHGTLHPDDLAIPLVLQGPSFAEGSDISLPAGLPDIAPTVLAMQGSAVPGQMSGRVLAEAFRSGDSHAGSGPVPTLAERGADGTAEIEVQIYAGRRYVLGGRQLDARSAR
jgi:arylsulfatase A-like enzyme